MQLNTSMHWQRGFNLVELMVAIVLGIIVSGAVVAFVASIIRANGQAIESTRLNQELRSLSEVILRDIKRSRSVSDPLMNIGNPPATPPASDTVATPGSFDGANAGNQGCRIAYTYQNPAGTEVGHAILLSADGNVMLAQGAAVGALACNNAGAVALNSPQVRITGLTICSRDAAGACQAAPTDRLDITITAVLRNQGRGGAALNRSSYTFRNSVSIRSGRVGS